MDRTLLGLRLSSRMRRFRTPHLTSAACAAAVLALLVDVLVVAWLRSTLSLTDIASLTLALAPVAVAVGIAFAATQHLLGGLIGRMALKLRRSRMVASAETAAAVAAAAVTGVAALAFSVAAVARMRAPGVPRPLLVAAAVLVASACAWRVARMAAGRRARPEVGTSDIAARRAIDAAPSAAHRSGASRSTAALFALLLGLLGVGFVLLDHLVAVRLHELLHLALRFASLAAFQAAVVVALVVRRDRWSASVPAPKLTRTVALFCLAAATPRVLGALASSSSSTGLDAGSGLGAGVALSRTPQAHLSIALLHGGSSASLAELHTLLRGRTEPNAAPLLPPPPSPASTDSASRLRASGPGALDGPRAAGASVLLVTIDALRADHLGLHGYHRATSPFIDAMAAQSAVFDRAYAAAPHTSFALMSLLIGQPAVSLAHLGRLDGHPTLADLLRRAGYATAAFIPPAVFFVDRDRFRTYEERQVGFHAIDMRSLPEETSAPVQTDAVLSYLDTRRPERFFAWVHYFGPHEPYVDHPEDGRSFGTSALDRYDSEIRWVDASIGRLIAGVRDRAPRTIVIITADHGEEFGDHGGAYHGTTLFDEQIRVPLIVSIPGVPPARIGAPVSAIDVLPTVLGALDVPAPAGLAGTDLRPLLSRRAGDSAGGDRFAVAENGSSLRMLASAQHKLICNTRWPDCMLFDLAADPSEQRDAMGAQPAIGARLRGELSAWVSQIASMSASLSASPSMAAKTDRVNTPESSAFELALARARLRDITVAPALLAHLQAPAIDVEQRREAARVLPFVATGTDAALIRQIASAERDEPTLAWLRTTLATLGDEDAAAHLERTLLATAPPPGQAGPPSTDNSGVGDPNLLVRGTLAISKTLAAPSTTLIARALALTDDVEVRCELFRALPRSGDRGAAAGILISEYGTVRTRICSAQGLAGLAEPRTVAFLVENLATESYTAVQLVLVEALARIGDVSAIPALRELGKATAEPELLLAVSRALSRLEAKGGGEPKETDIARSRPGPSAG